MQYMHSIQASFFKLLPEGLADIQFAPIGLVDMYNSGGALEALSCINDSSGCTHKC